MKRLQKGIIVLIVVFALICSIGSSVYAWDGGRCCSSHYRYSRGYSSQGDDDFALAILAGFFTVALVAALNDDNNEKCHDRREDRRRGHRRSRR